MLRLGLRLPPNGEGALEDFRVRPEHLVTHAVVTGMTGSGKTGLVFVLVEEALRAGVPVLVIDVKGDLANLLLAFEPGDPSAFAPWLSGDDVQQQAEKLCASRDKGLARANLGPADVLKFAERTAVRVLTPGTTSGEPVHLLSSLERRSALWDSDEESARDSLASAVSLVLRLLGRDADPARSREHVLLSVLAERRLRAGQPADLPSLLADLDVPPIEKVGAMPIDRFVSKKDRNALAAALNALIASPSFESWRRGAALDVAEWLAPREAKTHAVVLSVAHLDEEERKLVLGLVFDELLAYTRGLAGSSKLEALVVIDEVYGMLPPHPANPPTKRPLVSMMKQARAFGVGVVLATQNPMDLDYRALSNAGLWFVGRLQTDADRDRVIDGLADADGGLGDATSKSALHGVVKRLSRRWFLVRNVHDGNACSLLQPRQTICWLRGPMTRAELRGAVRGRT